MLTQGSIIKGLLKFLGPILLANILQQMYNTVDTLCIGYFLDTKALAAMGCTMALFELMMGLAQGLGNGISIVVAQAVGAKQNLQTSFWQALWLALAASTLFTLFGPSSKILLQLLSTPVLLIDQAGTYLSLMGYGMLISVFYNLLAGLCRAKGDAKTPLYALGIASVINTILDVLFIPSMGIAGAAWATLIAQAASILYTLLLSGQIKWTGKPCLDFSIIKEMAGQGASMAMMFSIVCLGTLALQTAINQLPTTIIAAHAASRKWFSILALPISSLAVALTTFVSQNKGAQQYERLHEGVKISLKMGWGYTALISLVVWLAAKSLLTALTGNTNATFLYWGSWYLSISTTFFLVLSPLLLLRNSLQGMGYKLLPLVSSVIELAGKLIFVTFLVPHFGYWGVIWTEPLIWCAMTAQLTYSYQQVVSGHS